MEKPAVLLVDDNDATVALVTALLQREFSVDPASDGSDAIEKLRTRQYAAVLLDLKMPRIDGFAVLDFLSTDSPETLKRVVVVTAALSRQEVARAKEFGVCGVIGKPFDVEVLLAAVKQCAGHDTPGPDRLFSSGMILLLADMLRQRFM